LPAGGDCAFDAVLATVGQAAIRELISAAVAAAGIAGRAALMLSRGWSARTWPPRVRSLEETKAAGRQLSEGNSPHLRVRWSTWDEAYERLPRLGRDDAVTGSTCGWWWPLLLERRFAGAASPAGTGRPMSTGSGRPITRRATRTRSAGPGCGGRCGS